MSNLIITVDSSINSFTYSRHKELRDIGEFWIDEFLKAKRF